MATAAGLIGGQVVSSLFGAREARKAGETQAAGQREAGRISAAAAREAAGGLQPFTVGGVGAAQQEAALSGALGPEAQQQALDAQVESPFTKFIEERGRRQIGQGFAAIGGLGGGQRLKALTEFGQGVATQSLSTQLQNLRNVRQAGTSAQLNIADLIAQAGGAEAGGVRGAATAIAQGGLARAGQIQQGIEGVTTIGALNQGGFFDRPVETGGFFKRD